jgi:hypothetical protein
MEVVLLVSVLAVAGRTLTWLNAWVREHHLRERLSLAVSRLPEGSDYTDGRDGVHVRVGSASHRTDQ